MNVTVKAHHPPSIDVEIDVPEEEPAEGEAWSEAVYDAVYHALEARAQDDTPDGYLAEWIAECGYEIVPSA